MLKMKPACERCAAALPADRTGAFICSFECGFCEACTGVLRPRPIRAAALLERFPPQG